MLSCGLKIQGQSCTCQEGKDIALSCNITSYASLPAFSPLPGFHLPPPELQWLRLLYVGLCDGASQSGVCSWEQNFSKSRTLVLYVLSLAAARGQSFPSDLRAVNTEVQAPKMDKEQKCKP